MKLKMIPSILLLMLCFSVSYVLISCTEEANDGDDDMLNCSGNGWSGGGCDCSREGGEEAAGFIAVTDLEDCIPPLPDERYRESLEVLLGAYLGTYEDQDGNKKQILCRPEGNWTLAADVPKNSRCVSYWALPVWLIYNTELDPAVGHIEKDSGGQVQLPPDPKYASVSFKDTNGIECFLSQDRETEEIRWIVRGPEEICGKNYWTKVSGL